MSAARFATSPAGGGVLSAGAFRAPGLSFGDRLMLNLRATRARAYVRVMGMSRQLSWVLSDTIFPNLGMCAFVLLYRALGAPRSYEALAVLGGVLSTYWLNVLWGMAAQFYWEKQQGQLQLYFVAPCSRMAILAGMALGGVVMTTLRAAVGLAIGFGIFHIQLVAFDPWMLLAVFAATMGALYTLGMTFASLFLLYGREAWHMCNAVQEPVFFASGLYFPIRALGAAAATVASLLPLTLGVDALRQVLLGSAARGLLPVATETAILAACTILFLGLARVALGYLERLSKREGRLTQRWQ